MTTRPGTFARLVDVMRSAFNDATELKIRPDAIGDMVECALISTAPKIVWKREAIAKELKIPGRKARGPTLSIEQIQGCWTRCAHRTCFASP